MPVVTNTIKRPDGTAYTSGRVVIELAGENGRPISGAYVTASDYTIESAFTIEPLTAGVWSQSLIANSLLNPAGTVWRITEQVDGRNHVFYVSVPDGAGPYFVEDILDEAPSTIASSALTAWAGRLPINVKGPSYGAVGDGVADDTAAIQAAIVAAEAEATTAYAGGAAVYFPPGRYNVTTLSVVAASVKAIKLVGAGPLSSTIFSSTGNVIELGVAGVSGINDLVVEGLHIYSGAGGGACVAVLRSCSKSTWRNVKFNQDNDAQPAFDASTDLDFNDNLFDGCRWDHTLTATVPTFDGRGDLCSGNEWRNDQTLYTGNYWIWLEPSTAGGVHYNNRVRGALHEVTTGGMVKMLGQFGSVIEDQTVFDLQISGPLLRDGFVIGQATVSSGQRSRHCKIGRIVRAGGALNAGIVDVNLTGSQYNTLERLAASGDDFATNLGSGVGNVVLGGAGNVITNDHGAIYLAGSESDAKAASMYFGRDASSVNVYRDDTASLNGLVIAPSETNQHGLQIRTPAASTGSLITAAGGGGTSSMFAIDSVGRIYNYVDSSTSLALYKGVGGNMGVAISSNPATGLQFTNVTTGTVDTNLFRSAANVLKTDDKFHVALELEVDGALNHDGTTVGFNGATPVAQGAAIVDADGTLADLTTKFNALLAYLRSRGDIAT